MLRVSVAGGDWRCFFVCNVILAIDVGSGCWFFGWLMEAGLMMPLANLGAYFAQSNVAGQLIVIVLVVCSFLAWTVMVGKYLDLKRLRELNRVVEGQVGKAATLIGLDPERLRLGRCPFAHLIREGLGAYHRGLTVGASEGGRMGLVENALQRSVAASCITYESRMVLLGSIVTGAPFLGLLGTVWGVMDAFGSIAGSRVGLETLAPGVTGALLTTVAGLLVAIPSVFGYNFLLTQSKLMVTELENFASVLADRIEVEDREHMAEGGDYLEEGEEEA